VSWVHFRKVCKRFYYDMFGYNDLMCRISMYTKNVLRQTMKSKYIQTKNIIWEYGSVHGCDHCLTFFYGLDDMVKCISCEEFLCKECTERCEGCYDPIGCITCVDYCADCNEKYCSACLVHCSKCDERYCNNCLVDCECGEPQCLDCVEVCKSCEAFLCKTCIKYHKCESE